MPVEKPTPAEAQHVLDYLGYVEPAWKEYIAALQEERHTDAVNTLLILAGNTLQSGNHMAIPVLDQFLDGVVPGGQTVPCPQCGNNYTLAYAGQPFCSNDCAAIARGEVKPMVPEIVEPELPSFRHRQKELRR